MHRFTKTLCLLIFLFNYYLTVAQEIVGNVEEGEGLVAADGSIILEQKHRIYPIGEGYFIFNSPEHLNDNFIDNPEFYDEYGEYNPPNPRYGIVSPKHLVSEEKYDDVVLLNSKSLLASSNGSVYVLDKNLKEKKRLPYEQVVVLKNHILLRQKGKYAFANQKLKPKTEFLYDHVGYYPYPSLEVSDDWDEEWEDDWGGNWEDDWGDDSFSVDPWATSESSIYYFNTAGYHDIALFEEVDSIPSEFYQVKIGKLTGLLDPNDLEEKLQINYNEIYLEAFNNLSHGLAKKDNKFIAIDPVTFQEISNVPPFDDIQMRGALFQIEIDGKFGLRNASLSSVIPEAFKPIKIYTVDENNLPKDVYFIEDESIGNVYEYNEPNIVITIPNIIIDSEFGSTGLWITKGKDGLGITDPSSGKKIVPEEYDKIIRVNSAKNYMEVVKDEKHGIIDVLNNKLVIPLDYSDIMYKKNIGFEVFGASTCGVINENGEVIVPTSFDAIKGFSNNHYRVSSNGKFGIYSISDKKLLFGVDYDKINYDSKESVALWKDGTVDYKNINTLKSLYDEPFTYYELGMNVIVKYKGKYGVIKEFADGTFINKPEYDELAFGRNYLPDSWSAPKDFLIAKKKGKYGVIRNDGFTQEPVLNFIYDGIKDIYQHNGFQVKKNNQLYFYNSHIEEFTDTIDCDNLVDTFCPDNKGIIQKNGKYGVYDYESKTKVLPIEYDRILVDYAGMLTAYKNTIKYVNYDLERDSKFHEYPTDFSDYFKLKWKTPTGYCTYRSTILEDNKQLYIASNGDSRSTNNANGFYILDASTGKIKRHYHASKNPEFSDTDFNAVAQSKSSLLAGTDFEDFYCFNSTGQINWTKPLGVVEGAPVIVDIDNDGKDEFIVHTRKGEVFCGKVSDGSKVWSYQSSNKRIMTSPLIADIDSDGSMEVISALDKEIVILDMKTGTKVVNYPSKQIKSTPIDAEGRIIFGTTDRFVGVMKKGAFPRLIAWVEISGDYDGIYGNITSIPGTSTLVIPTSSGDKDQLGRIIFYDIAKKKILNEYKTSDGAFSATPLIADLIGANYPQVVAINELGELVLFTAEGEKIHSIDLPSGAEATPLLKDIDNDGFLELIVNDIDGYTTCYKTKGKSKAIKGQMRFNNKNTDAK